MIFIVVKFETKRTDGSSWLARTGPAPSRPSGQRRRRPDGNLLFEGCAQPASRAELRASFKSFSATAMPAAHTS